MNYDEIMALEVGREMDAAVGKNVMELDVLGTLVVTSNMDCCRGYCVPYKQPKETAMFTARRPVYIAHCGCDLNDRQPGDEDYWGHYAACLDAVPDYSTDDIATLEIVDTMIAKGKEFELYHDSEGWSCHFTGTGLVYEETRGMAVCRAALLALEAE